MAKGSGRTCLFCGARVDSTEHVFPQWFSNWLKIETGSSTFTLDIRGQGVRRANVLNVESKRFCAECNSGWMNQIETAATPLIQATALNTDERVLSQDEQTRLATWCFKTTLTLASTQPKETWPDEDVFREFHRDRVPSLPVWIGVVDRPPRLAAQFSMRSVVWTPGEGENPVKFEQALMIVGSLFFGVIYNMRAERSIQMNLESAFYRRIWPVQTGGVRWPPPNPIKRDTLFADDVV